MQNNEHTTQSSSSTIYDTQTQYITKLQQSKEESTVKEKSNLSIFLNRIKAKRYEFIIGILYILYIGIMLANILAYIHSVYHLSFNFYNLSPLMLIGTLFAPLITWVISTKYSFYNYKIYKMAGLYIALLNIFLYLTILLEIMTFKIVLPFIFKIPVGISITPTMIVTLGRLAVFILPVGVMIPFAKTIFSTLSTDMTQNRIMHFKIDRNADKRKHKHFAYDMKIVRKMLDGNMYTIKEKDRALHGMTIGATGTGKTSSCLTVSINDDFDQKIYNEDWQKAQLYKMLIKRQIRLTHDFDDINFSANYFVPVENARMKIKKKLTKIQTIAPSAGVTAMAPNAAFADEIYELAKGKGLPVNRIDPEMKDGKHKQGFIGLNPYFISPRITGLEREIEIFSRSTLVADVIQAIFDQSGNSDLYFASLNQNITTTVSSTLLLTYPALYNRQPTLKDLQSIVNDFIKIKPYRDELIRLYAIKRNPDGSPIMDVGRANIGDYQFLLDTIDNELLGPGAVKMTDQARGLRIIVNQILVNPLVKDILCAEDSIDMDEMLANGQITVVNYALKLGSAGVALGLFFMLLFIKAVIRRPGTEKNRIPHFFYVDEFPTLLHPQEEMIFTYFRQFKTSAMVALQTLDQMDKSPATAFLRGVLIGNCAHQILFGRTSTSEMELYQKFAGTTKKLQEMQGYSETSLASDNPTYSMNYRESIQETDIFSTNDIRMRDFQEVTVFSVDKSAPVPPFHGRVDFLPEYKKLRKKRKHYDWHSYFVPDKELEQQEKNRDILTISIPVAQTNVNVLQKEFIPDLEVHTEPNTSPEDITTFIYATNNTDQTKITEVILHSSENTNNQPAEHEDFIAF